MKTARRVQEFISKQQLFADNAKVLVALSGGADSVALLRLLIDLAYPCYAVHCNFHLRGEESDRDEQFVTALCHALGVECEVVHFDTKAYAAEHKQSIEMAARELRYTKFEQIRQAQGLDVICVAHHQDDAVETLLLNLIRGAGINGLTGMKVKNGHVVRPLLCLTREEVIDYLNHLGQPYVTDSTNLTDMYARNKVRLQLLPLMQQINSAAKDNIMQASIHLGEAAIIYNKAIADANKSIVKHHTEGIDISIQTLLSTDVPQAYLFEILHPYGFNSAQVTDILRSLTAEPGRLFQTADYTLLRDRTHLQLRKTTSKAQESTTYTLPEEGILELPDGLKLKVCSVTPDANWQVPRCNHVVCLDATRISRPLILRHPSQGDRFVPFGMKGSKLLSDFYTDIKMPHTEKAQQWVLCHGEEIVWAVGLRGSERYRLDKNAKKVICVVASGVKEYRSEGVQTLHS